MGLVLVNNIVFIITKWKVYRNEQGPIQKFHPIGQSLAKGYSYT